MNKTTRYILVIGIVGSFFLATWSYIFVLKWIFILSVISFGLQLIIFTSTSKKPTIFLSLLNIPAFLALSLPVVDYFLKPPEYHNEEKPAYSMALARQGGGSFISFWNQFSNLWIRDFKDKLVEPDPEGKLPYIPRKNSCMPFYEGVVCTNSERLIGPEIKYERGQAFRILTIGESTTQGVPLDKEYLPWPRLLEKIIENKFTCSKPIEVLNGGLAGYTIKDSNIRLPSLISNFDPDIVLSYHGANSFPLIFNSIPPAAIKLPPYIAYRPSYLIHKLEMRWRTREFYKNNTNWNASDQNIQSSNLAAEYRKLENIIKSNHKKLFFITFNLSIDEGSPQDAIQFYKQGFPLADATITLNNIQTKILREISEGLGIKLIDSSKNLHGTYDQDNFIDLVHFTKKGDRIMANNVFEGIAPYLIEDKSLRCIQNNY